MFILLLHLDGAPRNRSADRYSLTMKAVGYSVNVPDHFIHVISPLQKNKG